MYKDCKVCGVFGFCPESGICVDCLEEGSDGEEQEAEEEVEET